MFGMLIYLGVTAILGVSDSIGSDETIFAEYHQPYSGYVSFMYL